VKNRDGAYHQGTVWPFLLGPFVTAWLKVNGDSPGARRTARGFLDGLEAHLHEACIGQVSEMFDADAPHRPRGCFAQAWSVAELLRALIEDIGVREMQGDRVQPVQSVATPGKAPRKKGRLPRR
jgi:glycogen debranching enzyme